MIDRALITKEGKLFHWLTMRFVDVIKSFDLDLNNLKSCPLVKVVDDTVKKLLESTFRKFFKILNFSIKSPLCLLQ